MGRSASKNAVLLFRHEQGLGKINIFQVSIEILAASQSHTFFSKSATMRQSLVLFPLSAKLFSGCTQVFHSGKKRAQFCSETS